MKNQATDDYAADVARAREEVFEMPGRSMHVVESKIAPSDYPVPTGYRLVVEPIHIEEVTRGGLVLPAQAIEAKEHLRAIGRVVAMGPLAYKHDKFRDPTTGQDEPVPWCAVGDWVAYQTYAGNEIRVRNADGRGYTAVRLINDDEVRAVITDPQSVLIYA